MDTLSIIGTSGILICLSGLCAWRIARAEKRPDLPSPGFGLDNHTPLSRKGIADQAPRDFSNRFHVQRNTKPGA